MTANTVSRHLQRLCTIPGATCPCVHCRRFTYANLHRLVTPNGPMEDGARPAPARRIEPAAGAGSRDTGAVTESKTAEEYHASEFSKLSTEFVLTVWGMPSSRLSPAMPWPRGKKPTSPGGAAKSGARSRRVGFENQVREGLQLHDSGAAVGTAPTRGSVLMRPVGASARQQFPQRLREATDIRMISCSGRSITPASTRSRSHSARRSSAASVPPGRQNAVIAPRSSEC
jgi:hypothetical protein